MAPLENFRVYKIIPYEDPMVGDRGGRILEGGNY